MTNWKKNHHGDGGGKRNDSFVDNDKSFTKKIIKKTKQWYISNILDPQGHKKFQHESQEIETIVVLVGPYRNLTTLIASAMALHPNCRVLNHAGVRILGHSKIDFLKEYSDQIFENFKRFALYASLGGTRGNFGGSIFYSHAFDQSLIKKRAANQELLDEGPIHSILWKESLMITNYLRQNGISTDSLIKANPSIKFLLPVRNPLACAKSNWEKGKYGEYYKGSDSYERLLESVVQDYSWYLHQKRLNPDNFFHFFEDEFNEELMHKLCNFFEINFNDRWARFVLENLTPKTSYQFDEPAKKTLGKLLADQLSDYPKFKNRVKQIAGLD